MKDNAKTDVKEIGYDNFSLIFWVYRVSMLIISECLVGIHILMTEILMCGSGYA
jgi:hypothetical protein